MCAENKPQMPKAQIAYGEVVYWITIVSCIICMIGPVISVAMPDRNILDPYKLFNAIFEGKNAEQIWSEAGQGFPGGHFYFRKFLFGDGFTQFGLALGCSVAFWALLVAVFNYIREKKGFYVFLSLWVACLVGLSMIGIVGGQH